MQARFFNSEKFWVGLVAAFVTATYINSLWGAFVFDDTVHILTNKDIFDLTQLNKVLWGHENAARPLVALMNALNYAMSGLNPWSYHLFNLLAHVLNAVLWVEVVRRGLQQLTSISKTHSLWISGFSGLLWGAHPLLTQAVTYVIQRGESMMGTCFLLTLWAFQRFLEDGKKKWLAVALSAASIGMGFKQVMIVTPFLVAGYSRLVKIKNHPLPHWFWPAIFSTLGIQVALHLSAPHNGGGALGSATGNTTWEYFRTQPLATLHYARLVVFPRGLTLDPGWLPAQGFWSIYPPLALWVGAWALSLWGIFKKSTWTFPFFWFLAHLFPSSSFFKIADIAFEHRAYLASAGVVLGAVLVAYGLIQKNILSAHRAIQLGGTAALLLASLTVYRNWQYGESDRIWADSMAKAPNNPRVYRGLGIQLVYKGKYDEAEAQFMKAISIRRDERTLGDICGFYFSRQMHDQAIAYCREALSVFPNDSYLNNVVGVMEFLKGNKSRAFELYQKALAESPDHLETLVNLGTWYIDQKQPEEAMKIYERIEKEHPEEAQDVATILFSKGAALTAQGKLEEAVNVNERAIKLDSKMAEAHSRAGGLWMVLGKPEKAEPLLRRAIELNFPSDEPFRLLGQLLVQQGRSKEALHFLKNALVARPQQVEVLALLAWVLAAHPDSSVRNPHQSLQYADQAIAAGEKGAMILETRAVAFAAMGQWKEALQAHQVALREAKRIRALAWVKDWENRTPLLKGQKILIDDSLERAHAQ